MSLYRSFVADLPLKREHRWLKEPLNVNPYSFVLATVNIACDLTKTWQLFCDMISDVFYLNC